MAHASDPAPIPGEVPQPTGPNVDPTPSETPFPEIMPNPSPSEAPQTPSFPDTGQPYDLS